MQISVELVGGGMIGSCDPFDLYLRKSGSLGCVDIVFNWTVASNHSKDYIPIDSHYDSSLILTWHCYNQTFIRYNFHFANLLAATINTGLQEFIFTSMQACR